MSVAPLYSLWTVVPQAPVLPFPTRVETSRNELIDAIRREIESELIEPLLGARARDLDAAWANAAETAFSRTAPRMMDAISALQLDREAHQPPLISPKELAAPLRKLSERCVLLAESTFVALNTRIEVTRRLLDQAPISPVQARALVKTYFHPDSGIDALVAREYGAEFLSHLAALALAQRVQSGAALDRERAEEILERAETATRKALARVYDEVRVVVGARKADEFFGIEDDERG